MEQILQILRDNKKVLFEKYPLKKMALFGSYSRGEETPNSDIDVAVELNGSIAMKFIELSYELEDLLQKKVDLVSIRGVKSRYLEVIEPDFIYV